MICSFSSLRTLLLATLATAMVTSAHDANAGFFKRDKTEVKTEETVSAETSAVTTETTTTEMMKTEDGHMSSAVAKTNEVVKTDAGYTTESGQQKVMVEKTSAGGVRTTINSPSNINVRKPTTIYKFNQ